MRKLKRRHLGAFAGVKPLISTANLNRDAADWREILLSGPGKRYKAILVQVRELVMRGWGRADGLARIVGVLARAARLIQTKG